MKNDHRAILIASGLVVAGFGLSGCVSAPTYGTSMTAGAQLVDDLGNMASMPKNKTANIEYKPRPDIVRPPELASMPEPQDSMASRDNPDWPEAPEEARKRLVAEATANQDNRLYESPLAGPPVTTVRTASFNPPRVTTMRDTTPPPLPRKKTKEESEEFRKALAISTGRSADQRRYLSEPPLAYRQPSETAPIGEMGEAERHKERERMEAAKKKKATKWWPL